MMSSMVAAAEAPIWRAVGPAGVGTLSMTGTLASIGQASRPRPADPAVRVHPAPGCFRPGAGRADTYLPACTRQEAVLEHVQRRRPGLVSDERAERGRHGGIPLGACLPEPREPPARRRERQITGPRERLIRRQQTGLHPRHWLLPVAGRGRRTARLREGRRSPQGLRGARLCRHFRGHSARANPAYGTFPQAGRLTAMIRERAARSFAARIADPLLGTPGRGHGGRVDPSSANLPGSSSHLVTRHVGRTSVSAGSIAAISAGSLVTTGCLRSLAQMATLTSTTSVERVDAHLAPMRRASLASRAIIDVT